MRRTVCNVTKAAVILASPHRCSQGFVMHSCPTNLGEDCVTIRMGGYCCTDGGVLSERIQCRLRIHLRELYHMQLI